MKTYISNVAFLAAMLAATSTSSRVNEPMPRTSHATADAAFEITVASLADSIRSIGKMIGITGRNAQLRIEPRTLRVRARNGSDIRHTLAGTGHVTVDSLAPQMRSERVAKIQALGFGAGDLAALALCSPAVVAPPAAPPGTSSPWPCALAPAAVAGVGIVSQTSQAVTVSVLILAALPYKQGFSADFSFVRNSAAWQLSRRTAWIVAE